jgi:hypothetical protein
LTRTRSCVSRSERRNSVNFYKSETKSSRYVRVKNSASCAGGKLGTENESLGNPAATVEERV